MESVHKIYINNDNKLNISLLNELKRGLKKDVTVFPLNLKDSLIQTLRNSRADGNFLIFNFDQDVSEIYHLSQDGLNILALSIDMSVYQAFQKMAAYLNPHENIKELVIDPESLFSLAEIFDAILMNKFQYDAQKALCTNYDFSFVPLLQKYNEKIFEKSGFKKKTYRYIKPLTIIDKQNLYQDFSNDIFANISYKIQSLLESLGKEDREKCSYVLWGESFRNDTLRDSINSICQAHRIPPETSINPFDYSVVLKKAVEDRSELGLVKYYLKDVDSIKLYDFVSVSLFR